MFGRKKAIFLIHGFGGGLTDTEFLVKYLKANYKCDLHPIVLPGHDQDVMYFVKYEEWIKASEEKLLELMPKYDQVFILGFSMGGVIASHLAAKYPKIKKVILLSAAFQYFTPDIIQNDIRDLMKSNEDDEQTYVKNRLLSDIGNVFKRVRPRNVFEFVKLVNELMYSIRYVQQPILIVHGLDDELVPLSSSEFAYAECSSKNKTFVKVKGGRHVLLDGRRQQDVTNLVLKFIQGGTITDELI